MAFTLKQDDDARLGPSVGRCQGRGGTDGARYSFVQKMRTWNRDILNFLRRQQATRSVLSTRS